MKTIWKFPLEIVDTQTIKIPCGFEYLCVQMQNNIPCLWVKVDPQRDIADWKLVTHGTGHDAGDTDGMTYLGTYQLHSSGLVFHVWGE